MKIVFRRVRTCISKANQNPNATEQRGRSTPRNKTDERDLHFVRDFINRFPKYESHYGRSESMKMYLAPNLNMTKIYKEYQLVCDFQNRKALSIKIFRRVFNNDFQLSFKRRKTDTCRICDELKINISSAKFDDKTKLEGDREKHYDDVARMKKCFNYDVTFSKDQEHKTACLTFYLQKTLETPSLSTNVCYYKRQLWTYNLCIYDEAKKQAFMYVWSEPTASRGAVEIGSCLKYHFNNFIDDGTKHIILYSDSCGGQNRNIKLTLLLKKYLCDSFEEKHLLSIQQKFFIPGHSFNNCDRSFAIIETQKKYTENIFVPDDWVRVISNAKKVDPKFTVTTLNSSDFYSLEILTKLIVNRKTSIDDQKINWFDIRKIINRTEKPFSLIVEMNNEEHEQNISKRNVSEQVFKEAVLNNSEPKIISEEKYKDLMALLKFIPEHHHAFYKSLIYNTKIKTDYGLATFEEEIDTD